MQIKQEAFKHSVFNFKDATLSGMIKEDTPEGRQERNITLKSQDGKQQL